MISVSESCLSRELTGQQSAGQWQANNDAHSAILCLWEQFRRRFLTEDIIDHLERSQSFLLQTNQSLFHRFDRRSEFANQPVRLQLSQRVKDVAFFQFRHGNTMQLQAVQRFDAQPLP